MAINNSINTKNLALDLKSGTGNITIGTDAVQKTINIGTSRTTAVTNIDCGTGNNFNFATSIDQTVTIGGATNTNQLWFKCGTAGIINVGASIAKTITMGNATVACAFTFSSASSIAFPSLEVTGTSQTLTYGTYFVANNGSLVTLTLPTTATLGTLIRVIGQGAGGWTIAQNGASQVINSTATSTTPGSGGSLSSGGRYDCVELVCTVVDTAWSIQNSSGTLAFV